MLIEARHLLPAMQIVLNFKEHTIINVELHYDSVKLLTDIKDIQPQGIYKYTNLYELPKDAYLKIQYNPYE
jgi:hypothetical protein